jgi:hypothetical protein
VNYSVFSSGPCHEIIAYRDFLTGRDDCVQVRTPGGWRSDSVAP